MLVNSLKNLAQGVTITVNKMRQLLLRIKIVDLCTVLSFSRQNKCRLRPARGPLATPTRWSSTGTILHIEIWNQFLQQRALIAATDTMRTRLHQPEARTWHLPNLTVTITKWLRTVCTLKRRATGTAKLKSLIRPHWQQIRSWTVVLVITVVTAMHTFATTAAAHSWPRNLNLRSDTARIWSLLTEIRAETHSDHSQKANSKCSSRPISPRWPHWVSTRHLAKTIIDKVSSLLVRMSLIEQTKGLSSSQQKNRERIRYSSLFKACRLLLIWWVLMVKMLVKHRNRHESSQSSWKLTELKLNRHPLVNSHNSNSSYSFSTSTNSAIIVRMQVKTLACKCRRGNFSIALNLSWQQ